MKLLGKGQTTSFVKLFNFVPRIDQTHKNLGRGNQRQVFINCQHKVYLKKRKYSSVPESADMCVNKIR